MKIKLSLLLVALVLIGQFSQLAHASYYGLVPNSRDPKEIITFDARYPYWTRGIYIATYPHHSWSKEGWTAEYYGGVVSDTNPKGPGHLIQFASWQMNGKNAPTSGIDFVHAGPYMSWSRSTWEGSSGGIRGHWPDELFKPKQWYRFTHRVWLPTSGEPHFGYAGVWMKALETGQWYHLATFKFPAELTGFNDMGGFMEYFSGNASEKAAAEFRNSYSVVDGKWRSEHDFTARNGGDDKVTLASGDNGRSVIMETTHMPIDPATRRRQKTEVVPQNFTLKQPEKPDFLDKPAIAKATAEQMGNQMTVRWEVSNKTSPQLGYTIDVYDGPAKVASFSANNPEDREHTLTLPQAAKGAVTARIALHDIFNQTSPEFECSARASSVMQAPANISNTPGVSYKYFESPKNDTWRELPDYSTLKPVRSGTTATPELTPRLRREGYAFEYNGFIDVPSDGIYTFTVVTACGARLKIGERNIIQTTGYRSIAPYTGSIALHAGKYPIQLQYYQGKRQMTQADDFLQLNWSGPGFAATPVPATAYTHVAAANEAKLVVQGKMLDEVNVQLTCQLSGFEGKPQRVEYYAVNPTFDYFTMQGGSSADYYLGSAGSTDAPMSACLWGGKTKVVRARAILTDSRTVDSEPITVEESVALKEIDTNGMRLTTLEHHLYPMNRTATAEKVTIVGESMGLLTKPHKGDVTLIAHLADLTPGQALPDGTQLESAGNWYAGIILRDNNEPRPGMPLGGNSIPYICLMGSADGATRKCDSTMIDGAGNQPSGDIGRDCKWFKLTRQGPKLKAFISKDGKEWKQVTDIELPKMQDTIEIGFVQYALPQATPRIHWATFDQFTVKDSAE